jgi:hypothetical protein
MPAILRRLPFYDKVTTIEVQGRSYPVLPLQIIVWVSLGPRGLPDLHPQTLRFPAVLDPAFTDSFLIHEQHLSQFAGFQLEHFRQREDRLRTPERVIPLYAGNVWLHRNAPGERDQFAAGQPFLFQLHRGIGITSGVPLFPRLPLLGARAFRGANLQVSIDYSRCRVFVRTPPRFWFFG